MSFQEIKSEPLGEEVEGVHDELNDDIIKRAEDVSDICFDHEDKIPIKEEIKQEIKPEPLDEDSMDVETHSCEDGQEKSDLQAMVDKLLSLILIQKLRASFDYVHKMVMYEIFLAMKSKILKISEIERSM